MLNENKALSAYEIADRLGGITQTSVPAMSVYRILDFLEQQNLVHKILSMNKYAACSHITCKHGHSMPRLAICSRCYKVDEMMSNDDDG